jgi:hypothetical protein
MASKANSQRFVLSLSLLLALILGSLPQPVFAQALPEASLPKLTDFIDSVKNGDATVIRGIYADDLFALPVVQQPGSNAGFVSRQDNTVTQFSMAAQFGTLGFLAHNTLSGRYFPLLAPGQKIVLVYGDGHLKSFRVAAARHYQAISPSSPYSDFKDLDTQQTLTAGGLFNDVYKRPGEIVFQTCIESNGNASWGRLFVIAQPESVTGSPTPAH